VGGDDDIAISYVKYIMNNFCSTSLILQACRKQFDSDPANPFTSLFVPSPIPSCFLLSFSLPLSFLFFSFFLFPPLRSRLPQIQLGDLERAVSSPSGAWGEAPAEIEFGAFYPLNLASDSTKFTNFIS